MTSGRDSSGSALEHMQVVDGLRGLAIGLVLWHHIPHLFGYALYDSPFWVSSQGAWLGVDLFFVVSGFLITSILLKTRTEKHGLRTFWARRSLRIFPLFYLYLAVAVAAIWTFDLLEPGDPFRTSWTRWLPYFFYLSNIHIALTTYPIGELNILWTLALEEQFYLVWPLVVLLIRGRQLKQICLMVLVLAPAFRVLAALLIGSRGVYVLPFGRADTLIMGAVLAILLQDDVWRTRVSLWCRRGWPLALAVIVYTLYVPYHVTVPGQCPRYWVVAGYSWVALSFAIILGAVVGEAGGKPISTGAAKARQSFRAVLALVAEALLQAFKVFLSLRPLRYLGKLCYGLYLWHWLVGDLLNVGLESAGWGDLSPSVKAALWLPLTVAVASVSWYGFEKPILRLKRLFSYQ